MDIIEPTTNLMAKLPNDFNDQLRSKKWQERKAALDQLNSTLVANPKLADNPEYKQLIDQLTRILGTDSNVNCAAQAARCLTGFAKGLQKKFGPRTAALAPVIFDKFKEKKAILREPLVELVDAVFASTDFANTQFVASILSAAKMTNPNQKVQLDQFLYRAFRCTQSNELTKEMLKELLANLCQHAFDPDAEVREASCAAMGAIQKCIGEKYFESLLSNDIHSDVTKMAKIAKYKEQAENDAAVIKYAFVLENGPNVAFASSECQDSQEKSIKEEIDQWDLLEAVDIMTKLPDNLNEQLLNTKWQERKEALDLLNNVLVKNPKLADNPKYRQILNELKKILGTDLNVNCAAQAARCLTGFAKGLRTKFGPQTAALAPVIFDKFKEKKAILREPLVELLDAVFASSTLSDVVFPILEAAKAKKAIPSQKAQLNQFLYRAFCSMNPKDVPKGLLKELFDILCQHAFDPDPEVRDSSFAAFGAIQNCIGDKAFEMSLGNNALCSDQQKMAKIAEYREKVRKEHPNPTPPNSSANQVPAETQSEDRKQPQKSGNTASVKTAKKEPASQVQPSSRQLNIQKDGSTNGQQLKLVGIAKARPTQKRILSASDGIRRLGGDKTIRQNGSMTARERSTNNNCLPNATHQSSTCRPFTSSAPSALPSAKATASYHYDYVNSPSGTRIPRLVDGKGRPLFDSEGRLGMLSRNNRQE